MTHIPLAAVIAGPFGTLIIGYIIGAVRWNHKWMNTLDTIRKRNHEWEQKAREARNARRRQQRAAKRDQAIKAQELAAKEYRERGMRPR